MYFKESVLCLDGLCVGGGERGRDVGEMERENGEDAQLRMRREREGERGREGEPIALTLNDSMYQL